MILPGGDRQTVPPRAVTISFGIYLTLHVPPWTSAWDGGSYSRCNFSRIDANCSVLVFVLQGIGLKGARMGAVMKRHVKRQDPSPALLKKERVLLDLLKRHDRVLVAYSGGTDSTLLLREAVAALGPERVVAVTAVSEVFPSFERERAAAICRRLKVEHRLLPSAPLSKKAFCRNDQERCYHCKRNFFSRLRRLSRDLDIGALLEASQVDDRSDYRPGAKAVAAYGVLSPLQEAGLNKAEVRRLSRYHGLPTADLPAAACLASRVPYGTAITKELLGRIGKAEEVVRRLGFHQFRLRHHGNLARLEFDPSEMDKAYRYRRSLVDRVKAYGWNYVSLDLTGYRQGSLNEPLKITGDPRGRGRKKPGKR